MRWLERYPPGGSPRRTPSLKLWRIWRGGVYDRAGDLRIEEGGVEAGGRTDPSRRTLQRCPLPEGSMPALCNVNAPSAHRCK